MKMGCRGHDRMVVGFPITCAISAYYTQAGCTWYNIMW